MNEISRKLFPGLNDDERQNLIIDCCEMEQSVLGENINLIMKRNNLSNPVYVGDTQGDLDAARFANIPFVYAEYGFGQVSEYDLKVERFEELLTLF